MERLRPTRSAYRWSARSLLLRDLMAGLLPSLLIFSYSTGYYDLAVVSPVAAGCSNPATKTTGPELGATAFRQAEAAHSVFAGESSVGGVRQYVFAAANRHAAACDHVHLQKQHWSWLKRTFFCPMADTCWRHVFMVTDSSNCLIQSKFEQVAEPHTGKSCDAAGGMSLGPPGKQT
jgi:hypothetical protein